MKKLILFLVFIFSLGSFAQQKPPFWEDIMHFRELDRQMPPPSDAILLVGSSSFTMWKDVADYFPDKTIINRGFGGSSLQDLNFYADDLLQPYHPKQIVIYCGENDFASDKNLLPEEAFGRFKIFYQKIRTLYPNIPVDYISIKMSPSRKEFWPKFTQTNRLIKRFLKHQKNSAYIDITKIMEDGNGKVRKDLFLDDMLHMNPEGYRLWKKVMEPYLK
ncbi:GDSL-type esterase/lipase family protein [Weeksellaceae bacterium A-14]